MKIPVQSGKTSLAYVTDEERKLLRRRDAVKGSPNKKMTYGIPRLDPDGGGGGDYRDDMRRAKELRAKEDALKAAGFTKALTVGGGEGAGGAEKYVHIGKGLSAGYVGAPRTPIKYGSGPDEIRRFPSMGGMLSSTTPRPTPTPTPTPTPAPTLAPTSSSGGGGLSTSSSTPAPASDPPPDPAPAVSKASSTSSDSVTIDRSQLQKPMLDEIVADGVNSELLETRLANLINKNSPLFKAATTKTMQAMAARGLVNSSIAEEAVMNAILSVAMPIAERDASAYMNQRMQNQAYSNEFREQQNQAYYQSFIMKLQQSMDIAMRQLMENAANWRAVLAARSNIVTTEGMGADAAEAAMAAVTPNWFTDNT
tara:strand:- start:94 stop:1194 length:1101 start_codon:yes stop_codon:yes gene_type:complete